MNIKSALKEIGLPNNEAIIYTTLLELGSALAGEITKRSGINRTNVYDALDRLIEKGLASYILLSNRKHFEATEPEKIISFLEEKENILKKQKKNIQSILSDIKVKRKLSKQPQEATIYKGKKGLKSVAEDVLNNKEFLVYGAESNFMKLFPYYGKHWHNKRKKLKIPLKIIYNEKIRKKREKMKLPLLKMRFSKTLEDTPATTWIYGDKVAIIVWSEQPIATLIRSKEVAKSYKQFFEILWKSAKP